ncbi:hypothetical protein LIER_10520 [Lithospermum erythrorhizon]|uniref:Uncharacterized protein n=1 Tax=Lithospermum erythrorhizon TaxID=34254 RepID=A0AAV3PLC6_LITER
MKEINSPLPLHAEQGKILELEKSLSIEMFGEGLGSPFGRAHVRDLRGLLGRIGEGRRPDPTLPPPKAIYALFSLQRAYTENR